MRFFVYAVVTVILVAGCGAWLRWASVPVLLAFGAGLRVERLKRRAAPRGSELSAMAWHGRVPQFNVPAIEAGAAVSGPVHHHREAA